MAKLRHFLQFKDLARGELEHLFARTKWIKAQFKRYKRYWPLEDRTLVMIFEKQSTRTRLSFEAGMHQLGGAAIFLSTRDSQLGRGEPVEDAAQVISRMCDVVMIRTFEQSILERFAAHSRVPVINGLTNEHHPCQVLADVFTYIEHRGSIAGKVLRPALMSREPRGHYLLNCLSIGCPNLLPEAITGAKLERQMAAAAAAFVRHPRALTVSGGKAKASSLYDWYAADFGGTAGVIAHMAAVGGAEVAGRLAGVTEFATYDYDWALADASR